MRDSAAAAVGASAPGRINLIGEHLDYNGGPVFPLAIDRRTAVRAAPAAGWRFTSALEAGVARRDPAGAALNHWSDYVVGVVRALQRRNAAPPGAAVSVASRVPVGAGLASSAALTVAAARALSRLAGRRLDAAALVDVAFEAEHDYVGVRCGRMDQTVAACAREGAALRFDTATGIVTHVRFPWRVWVVDTGVSHRLAGGQLNERRRECEAALAEWRAGVGPVPHLAAVAPRDLPRAEGLLVPRHLRRLRHVVTETARTAAAAAAVEAGDGAALGALLVEGHESLRCDFESSLPEADAVVDAAVRHGAYGARLTGAGWGGSVLVLAPETREHAVIEGVQRDFRSAFGRLPDVWSSRPAGGVRDEAAG